MGMRGFFQKYNSKFLKFNFRIILIRNYASDLFKILRCDRKNIFPHFCFSTYLILSKKYFRGFFKRLPIKVFFEISYIFVKN